MTIHLPPHIASSIQAVVHSGRYASLDDAMTEAASLLLQQLGTRAGPGDDASGHANVQADLGGIRGYRRQHPGRGMGQIAR